VAGCRFAARRPDWTAEDHSHEQRPAVPRIAEIAAVGFGAGPQAPSHLKIQAKPSVDSGLRSRYSATAPMTQRPHNETTEPAQSESDGGGEDALIAIRREKAERVRAAGKNPFANDVNTADRAMAADIRAEQADALLDPPEERRYDPEKVAIKAADRSVHFYGRLIARRGFGKVSFLNVRDVSGDLQVFCRINVLGDDFKALEDIDIGDHIEVVGPVMVTKTGELSIEAKQLRLITKALRPLPDKWHGLTDVDARYRQRYVDMVANPGVRAALTARTMIVQGLRDYLDGNRYIEVETPTLHQIVGGATAKPFNTHHNTLDLDLFLRIAPELYLKRLLVGGFERVYEIGRCYRNEGISTRHNPEFTMLEFYQAYATYETLMDVTEAMLRHVDAYLERRLTTAGYGSEYLEWKSARQFTIDVPFARVPMIDAIHAALEKAGLPRVVVEELASIAVKDGLDADPSGKEKVQAWANTSERAKTIEWGNLRKGLGVCANQGERIFIAYEYLAEPFLPEDYRTEDGKFSLPVFIRDYPAETSPLARRKDSDPTLTDRFELFVDGRELCNAFSELNDPDDQDQRFKDQVARKARGDEETMDYDEDYVRALQHGMPPAAGFGLGVDRLTMMLAGQSSIRDVIAFPLLRPES
jgi:lysyl-tRNA synthetase, class II